jgi:hypothetical protein
MQTEYINRRTLSGSQKTTGNVFLRVEAGMMNKYSKRLVLIGLIKNKEEK